jgi:hypothetical protein
MPGWAATYAQAVVGQVAGSKQPGSRMLCYVLISGLPPLGTHFGSTFLVPCNLVMRRYELFDLFEQQRVEGVPMQSGHGLDGHLGHIGLLRIKECQRFILSSINNRVASVAQPPDTCRGSR